MPSAGRITCQKHNAKEIAMYVVGGKEGGKRGKEREELLLLPGACSQRKREMREMRYMLRVFLLSLL